MIKIGKLLGCGTATVQRVVREGAFLGDVAVG